MLPYEKVIPNRLKDKQEIVGGNIEYTRVDNDGSALLICNEEGKIRGLPYNRDIGHDVIAGTFLIVGDDPDIGEDRSLTDEQVEKYKARFDRDSIEQTKQTLNRIMSEREFEL
jgi:transposase